MNLQDIQASNEYHYSKKHIDNWLMENIQTSTEIQTRVAYGVELLEDYINGEYYQSKQARVDQLQDLDLKELTEKVFAQVAYYRTPTLFVTVVSQVCNYLGFTDRVEGAQTMAEIISVLCHTDAYDISKASKMAQLMIESKLALDTKLVEAIDRGIYILPMVTLPKQLVTNRQSPYLTFNESVFTGRGGNTHGNLCLDVLNIQNRVPLSLDVDFLTSVEETPNSPPETVEQLNQWNHFKNQSYGAYKLLIQQGNRFYITNKWDKRGRMYAQGYHVSSQGTAFKKACIEFADKKPVDGVPT